nr:hypothetical protein [Tanacetum cinerariifolium]
MIVKDKGSGEKGGSTADQVSIARPEVSAAALSTPPTTTTIFEELNLTNGADTEVIVKDKGSGEKGGSTADQVSIARLEEISSSDRPMRQETTSGEADAQTRVLSLEEAKTTQEKESQILWNVDIEDKHVYKIIRANGDTSYHKSLSSMLRKCDRQDLVDLYRLVMERFKDNTLEGYNLLLWGDLKATVKVKIVNGEEQIQALVDKKKVIIIETSVKSDLHLEDTEGTECLPTVEELTLMGYEFFTQNLTFYKAFFSPQ